MSLEIWGEAHEGKPVASAKMNNSGVYIFPNIASGTYYCSVTLEANDGGWRNEGINAQKVVVNGPEVEVKIKLPEKRLRVKVRYPDMNIPLIKGIGIPIITIAMPVEGKSGPWLRQDEVLKGWHIPYSGIVDRHVYSAWIEGAQPGKYIVTTLEGEDLNNPKVSCRGTINVTQEDIKRGIISCKLERIK